MNHRLASLFLIIALSPVSALSAAPTVSRVSPPGITAGREFTITVTGSDLLAAPRLVTTFPLQKQELQQGATAGQLVFKVTVPADVPAGIHGLRIATATGNSNLVAVGVDRLSQQSFAERLESIPVAVNGTLAGGQILKTTFAGSRGDRVVIDVEAARLGSNARPVVRLLDARGTQLAWSPPQPRLQGDARCELELPADGEYTVHLHDVLYKGPQGGFFRLKVGALDYADMTFPLAIKRGTSTPVQLISASAGLIESLEVHGKDGPLAALPLGKDGLFGGARPYVILSDINEVLEQEVDGDAIQQLPALPVAIHGRLTEAGKKDRYQLPVAAGQRIRLDVTAERAGSAIDGVLTVRDALGNQLGRNDDQGASSDPRIDLTVPAGVELLTIELEDLQRSASSENIYRIAVTDLGQPSFGIQLASDHLAVPTGASQAMKLQVTRSGYAGPIELSAEGLPEGVTLSGTTIPAGSNNGLVAFSSTKDNWRDVPLRIVGTATSDAGDGQLQTVATIAPTARWQQNSWLQDETLLSPAVAAPVSANWGATAQELTLLQGTYQGLHVDLPRQEGAAGNVRFRLLTDQVIPKKKIKQNNKDVMVDDLDRALRLEAPPMVAAGTDSADLNLWVPVDLATRDWQLSVVAELLAADNKTVISSVTTPVIQLQNKVPMTIALEGEAVVKALAGDGETGHLKGTINREAGYDLPLTVTLEGLPKGYPAPQVAVAGDATTFDLEVRFPEGTKPAELKDIKLLATVRPDPKREGIVFRSNALPVTVNVVAP